MTSADHTFQHPRADLPGRHTIVRLDGALDINAAPALRERLTGVLHRGASLLVLDLSRVASCDVAGLAVLIGTQRRARQLGRKVRLAAPSPAAAQVLRSSGLERSFTICQDRSGVLAPGQGQPETPQVLRSAVARRSPGLAVACPGGGAVA